MPLTRRWVAPAARVLSELDVPIAGSYLDAMRLAICEDAARRRSVVGAVAADGDCVAGIALAAIDHRRYWRSYGLRRPWLALRVALDRRARPKTGEVGEPAVPAELRRFVDVDPIPRSWSESSATAARSIYIGVAPAHQGRRLSLRLYSVIFEQLRERGVRYIDASIEKSNAASVLAHRLSGYRLYEDDARIYATRLLT